MRYKEELPLFNQMVMALPIGKTVEAVVLRAGKEVTLKVTPVTRPLPEARPRECKGWGMSASNITTILAKELQLNSTEGVLVRGVTSGGGAGSAKPALEEGDVLCEVNQQPVKSLEDLRTLTRSSPPGKMNPSRPSSPSGATTNRT